MDLRALARDALPPVAYRAARGVKHAIRQPEWLAVREWPASAPESGWQAEGAASVQLRRLPAIRAICESTAPLTLQTEADEQRWVDRQPYDDIDVFNQNAIMTFAYSLGLAAAGRETVRVLDWGGGVGFYYFIASSLFPSTSLHYKCLELPGTVRLARAALPGVAFTTDVSALDDRHDLVFANSSLQYIEEWRPLVGAFARAGRYVFVNAIPVVHRVPTFVLRQRTASYETMLTGWCFNRRELLETASGRGLVLEREFVNWFKPSVKGAPEQPEYRGFLFRGTS